MKSISKKSGIILIVISVLGVITLLFSALRYFHIVLRVGDSYKLCFSREYRIDGNWNVNDDNISEITFMKRLKHFSALDTSLTNIDFITELNKLESLSVSGNSVHPEGVIQRIPSLKNLPELEYIYLFDVDVDNLDFISDISKLKYLTVITYSTQITDISGLKDKQDLKIVQLQNVNCSDYSVLLDLPSLEKLYIYGNKIPDEIENELIKKNVKIIYAELSESDRKALEEKGISITENTNED